MGGRDGEGRKKQAMNLFAATTWKKYSLVTGMSSKNREDVVRAIAASVSLRTSDARGGGDCPDVEAGLHHTEYPAKWREMMNTVHGDSGYVIATTQSYEFIEVAYHTCVEMKVPPGDFSVFRVEEDRVVEIPMNDVGGMIEMGLEIR